MVGRCPPRFGPRAKYYKSSEDPFRRRRITGCRARMAPCRWCPAAAEHSPGAKQIPRCTNARRFTGPVVTTLAPSAKLKARRQDKSRAHGEHDEGEHAQRERQPVATDDGRHRRAAAHAAF